MQSVDGDLSKFKKARDWRRDDASALFGSEASWLWFKRNHSRELIESGALIVRAGRSGDLVNVDRIGAEVQRILQNESLKRIDGLNAIPA